MISDELKTYAVTNVPKKISNIIVLLKLEALNEEFVPETKSIHLANGTLFLDSTFDGDKSEIVRSRLPVKYNPYAPTPKVWLSFLDSPLYPDDIPTLQELIGYSLIPSK